MGTCRVMQMQIHFLVRIDGRRNEKRSWKRKVNSLLRIQEPSLIWGRYEFGPQLLHVKKLHYYICSKTIKCNSQHMQTHFSWSNQKKKKFWHLSHFWEDSFLSLSSGKNPWGLIPSRTSKKWPVVFRSSPCLSPPGPEGGQLHCFHKLGYRGLAQAGSSVPGSPTKPRAFRVYEYLWPLQVVSPWPLTALGALLILDNAALWSP